MEQKKCTDKAFPTCPHCGHEHGRCGPFTNVRREYAWESTQRCESCDKQFKVYPVTLYSTFAVEEASK